MPGCPGVPRSALENLDRAVMLSSLVMNVTNPVQRRRIRRLSADDLPEHRQGGIDLSSLVQLRCLGEEVFGRSHCNALRTQMNGTGFDAALGGDDSAGSLRDAGPGSTAAS